MKRKEKQWILITAVGLVFGLCSCQNGQKAETWKEIVTETQAEILNEISDISDMETLNIESNAETSYTETTINDSNIITEVEHILEPEETKTTEKETVSQLEEKWNTYWADGEFTFEETELILQEAGYWKEDWLYVDAFGHSLDVGLTYEFIRDGSVFQKQEDGSFILVSALESEFGDFDSKEIDDWIRSYGYEIEYNNDKPYVYDGKGNSYSYDELASFLLEGETIPYAPQNQVDTVNQYVAYLEGDWVSAGGSQIRIEERNGEVLFECAHSRADGSKIVEVYAKLEVSADGSFIGYYDGDPWGNQGTIYGEYREELGLLYLVITVDVDGGRGWSCQMDDMCVRRYEMPFEDFVSTGTFLFQNGYTWCNDYGKYINIWGNGTYYYIDMYNSEDGIIKAYELDTRLYQDENGVYFNIEDSYCYGKVYLYFCMDDLEENLWIFTKMEIPVADYGYYLNSDYTLFFDSQLYCLQ